MRICNSWQKSIRQWDLQVRRDRQETATSVATKENRASIVQHSTLWSSLPTSVTGLGRPILTSHKLQVSDGIAALHVYSGATSDLASTSRFATSILPTLQIRLRIPIISYIVLRFASFALSTIGTSLTFGTRLLSRTRLMPLTHSLFVWKARTSTTGSTMS